MQDCPTAVVKPNNHWRQSDLARKGMQMPHRRFCDLPQPRIFSRRHLRQSAIRDAAFIAPRTGGLPGDYSQNIGATGMPIQSDSRTESRIAGGEEPEAGYAKRHGH
jgi:hypothetical protein